MKIIAWYLPQFHAIPENDAWWGEGFTEWVNVKNAKPLTEGHNQPRVPLGGNYYNLLDDSIKAWQVRLAKEHGVYGFAMHHYWFDGKLLLEKPVEQYLANPALDLPFCICWANEHWTNQWTSGNERILMEQHYGAKPQWKEHFDYLLPFFKDKRYIRIGDKPLFIFYRPELIECLPDMMDYWQELAHEAGLQGLSFAYQGMKWDYVEKKDDSRFDFDIEYQPGLYFAKDRQEHWSVKLQDHLPRWVARLAEKPISIAKGWIMGRINKGLAGMTYDKVWSAILQTPPRSEKSVPGAFVDWDNTPRKGERGSYLTGVTPEKFCDYLTQQLKRAKDVYRKDMLFMFSWNEWAEGGYLEPDTANGYGYLEAIRTALQNTGSWPST